MTDYWPVIVGVRRVHLIATLKPADQRHDSLYEATALSELPQQAVLATVGLKLVLMPHLHRQLPISHFGGHGAAA